MNIHHIIESDQLYGATKVLLSLVQVQKKKHHVVIILITQNTHINYLNEFEKTGATIHVLKKKSGVINNLKIIDPFIKLILQAPIDIIHSHCHKSDFLLLFIQKKIQKIRTLHGNTSTSLLKIPFWIHRISFFLLRQHNHLIAVSPYSGMKERLYTYIFKDNFSVILNGAHLHPSEITRKITTNNDNDILKKETKNQHFPTLISIGRLSKEKGHIYLLQAFSKLINTHPKAKLLIIGNGNEYQRLQEYITKHSLSHAVSFLGYQQNPSQFLIESDIFILPSLTEQVSISLLEAILCKIPTICTNVGENFNLLNQGKNGKVINKKNSHELLEAILEWINISDQSKKQITNNAFNFIQKNYSFDNMYQSYEAIYKTVLSQS